MKKILLKSKHNFLVQLENKNYIIDNKQFIEIENVDYEVSFCVYPIDNKTKSLPYCVCLDLKDLKNNPHINLYSFEDRYEVHLNLFTLPSETPLSNFTCQIKNIKYLVKCYTDRISVSSQNGEYVYETQGTTYSLHTKNNCIYLLCKNEDVSTLIIFDPSSSTFSAIYGEKIEFDDTKIKCLQEPQNTLHHKILSIYETQNGISKVDTQFYEKQNSSLYKIPNELVAYRFFDAIKMQDFATAKKFTTKKLGGCLTNEVLSSYFSNIKDINLYKTDPLIYTLYFVNDAKDYKITMQNYLIDEIEDI